MFTDIPGTTLGEPLLKGKGTQVMEMKIMEIRVTGNIYYDIYYVLSWSLENLLHFYTHTFMMP